MQTDTKPGRCGAGTCLAVLAALVLAGPGVPTTARAQNLEVKEVKLENGLTILMHRRPGNPTVAAGWVAKVGSVNEKPGITGLSHLFEHMMFKGTHVIGTKDIAADLANQAELDRVRALITAEQNELDRRHRLGQIEDPTRPEARSERHVQLLAQWEELTKKEKDLLKQSEMDQIYTANGGSGLNAGTNNDWTIYFVNIPANKLELWFWLESDRLMNPVFRQFYTERDVVWEERRMRTDSTPTGKLDEEFDAMFWKASPYSWPVIGWPSDLDGITREEALAYFERNYSPNNLTVALVGDFDLADAERLAHQYFGRIKRAQKDPEPMRTFEPEQQGMRRLEAEADTKPTVTIRWPAVPYGHVDEAALSVMADLLNGTSGRLAKSLVQEQKVATSASAAQEGRRYGGYFDVDGVAAPGKTVEDVEAALHREIEQLKAEPVSDRELQKVKNQAVADTARRFDSNFFVMFQLVLYDTLGSWKDINTLADKVLAVTAADVQRVAKKYCVDTRRNVAVYRTKTKSGDEAADPLWDAMSPDLQGMASGLKAMASAETDATKLEGLLGKLGEQRGAAPPEAAAFFVWAENFIKTRLAALQGGAK